MSVEKQNRLAATLVALLLGALYICLSAGLITFNKYLVNEDHFPFAVHLVSFHMLFCTVVLGLAFPVAPCLFPSLANRESRAVIRGNLPYLLVIALFFSGQLVLTNAAYLKSSVAFLQMMKEGNVVLVYVFSLLVALDTFSVPKGLIICGIIAATSMTINGEIHFSRTGFIVQATSQWLESTKLVLQSIVLSGAGKCDALSYNLLVAPISGLLLGAALLVLAVLGGNPLLKMPTAADVGQWWPVLLANAAVALLLNIVMAQFVKKTSAVALVLAGIVKDATIVLSGHIFFREELSHMQEVGFTFQLLLIFVWSRVKEHERAAAETTAVQAGAAPADYGAIANSGGAAAKALPAAPGAVKEP